jgi:hypothetical protein
VGTRVWAWFEPWWNLTGGHSLPAQAFWHTGPQRREDTRRRAGWTLASPLICWSRTRQLAAAQSRFLAVTYLAAPHTWLGEGRFYMPARGGGFGRTAGG